MAVLISTNEETPNQEWHGRSSLYMRLGWDNVRNLAPDEGGLPLSTENSQ
jgi:hypothetical protein